MKYIKNFELPYLELNEEDNLYDDVDLAASDIVMAQYWKYNGHLGNPDICALPRPASKQEIQVHHNIPLTGYDEKEVEKMSVGERKRGILSLRDVRFPFPFHSRIDQYLYSVLVASYAKRKLGITERPEKYVVGDEVKEARIIMGDTGITSNAIGFSVIGAAGSGKSTALEMVTDKYPKAILHNLPEYSYVQIPIIRLTAFANGNLSALYYMFAKQIDSILDSGCSHYDKIKSTANLGRMTELIITWIKRYHIGVIIIDEIQLMDFGTSNSKSVENLLTITAMTGIPLVMVGTEDASTHWHGVLRLCRRTEGLLVRADEYCKQKEFVQLIIKRIWKYQWVRNRVPLTEDISQTIYDESMGSIDLLILLWMTVQYEAISSKPEPEIDSAYIRKIAKTKFGHMQRLLKDSLVESEKKYLEARQSVIDTIRMSAEADEQKKEMDRLRLESERNIRDHYDRDLQMRFVIDSIQACHDYSETMIRKAYAKAEKEENFTKLNRQQATKKVMSYLEKPAGRKSKNSKSKQGGEADPGLTDRLRAELEASMNPAV